MRYKEVNLVREDLSTKGWRRAVERGKCENNPNQIPTAKSSAVFRSLFAALCYYLLNNDGECRVAAHEGLRATEDYFFGNWRSTVPSGNAHDQAPDPSYWHRIAAWCDGYIMSSLWAACFDEWNTVRRLSEYVTDVVEQDVGQTMENRAWLIALAGVLRGEDVKSLSGFVDLIRNGKRKREKLLLEVLLAIQRDNDDRLTEASETYFTFYKARESKKHSITSSVMIDGSFLVHYSNHVGRPISIPEKVMPHFVAPRIKQKAKPNEHQC